MIRALVAACLALLAISATAAAQDAGCSKDVDCKGSRICVEHVCVDPPSSAVRSCGSDLDCAGDDICEQHLCVPPPTVKKGKGKSRKEKQREAQKSAPAPAPSTPAAAPDSAATAAPPASAPPAPGESAPPAAAPVPAPASVAPAPAPQASQPAPEPVQPAMQPPAAPPELIVAPPLVSASPPPPPPASNSAPSAASADDSGPTFLYGAGLTAGIHTWSSSTSETDFGLDFNADFGVGITRHFGIELLGQGSFTPMLSSGQGTIASPSVSHDSFLGAFGVGVRLAHLGPIPGAFVVGGLGSFATITSSDTTPAINISGGAFLFQYSLPVLGPLQARGQLEYHFLSDGFSLFTLTAGIAIGD